MDNLLKKAGAMTAHLDLFQHMLHLRGLLQLAAHMEERGDRVTMVSADNITLIGAGMDSAGTITTTKGAEIGSQSAYSVLRGLKGHDAPEYAVTREELKALNARAVSELDASDAMRAFGETLSRITAMPAAAAGSERRCRDARRASQPHPSRRRRTQQRSARRLNGPSAQPRSRVSGKRGHFLGLLSARVHTRRRMLPSREIQHCRRLSSEIAGRRFSPASFRGEDA